MRIVMLATLGLGLAACSLAPAYRKPAVPVADQYLGATVWKEARPADQWPRGGWWRIYRDPRLDQLQAQLLANNADLAAAYAHYRQAEAFTAQLRAGLFPQVGLNGGAERNRQSDTRPLRGANSPSYYDAYTFGASASYEVDLWGRVRDSVAAGAAEQAAAQADLASVQLSLQTQLADSYLAVGGLDRQVRLLQDSIKAYQRALDLTVSRHEGGIASGLDVARAQTQLSDARSQWSQTQAQRALLVHAIAVLVGQSASQFELPTQDAPPPLPSVPLALPAQLLQRRPDIAAAERRTAAANARIGVARSAFFPQITLGAQGGYQSTGWADLATAPNRFWAIGPSVLLTVFDGGRRKAAVAAAKAATDEAGAKYRGVVLAAFQQVEDNLSLLDDLGRALVDQQAAADAARHTLELSLNRYRQGAVSYLDVTQAQTAALDTQRSLLDLQTRQLRASVQLVRAIGGGWSPASASASASASTVGAGAAPGGERHGSSAR